MSVLVLVEATEAELLVSVTCLVVAGIDIGSSTDFVDTAAVVDSSWVVVAVEVGTEGVVGEN